MSTADSKLITLQEFTDRNPSYSMRHLRYLAFNSEKKKIEHLFIRKFNRILVVEKKLLDFLKK